jgi:hypothetical protein
MFILLFAVAIPVAGSSVYASKNACHKNAALPNLLVTRIETLKLLRSNCNTIAASLFRHKFPDKALRISASPSMPETFSATATLPFLM